MTQGNIRKGSSCHSLQKKVQKKRKQKIWSSFDPTFFSYACIQFCQRSLNFITLTHFLLNDPLCKNMSFISPRSISPLILFMKFNWSFNQVPKSCSSTRYKCVQFLALDCFLWWWTGQVNTLRVINPRGAIYKLVSFVYISWKNI